MEVGFVGLGLMGKPMARHLMRAGHRVHVHNRSRGVVDELAAEGAIAATSAKQVAGWAAVVRSCLPSTEQARSGSAQRVMCAGAGRGRSASKRHSQLFLQVRGL
jgi:3-hydroxyisobutyrate dehydrogenase-like beta-hydroxyacid dehydrogenase